MAAHALEKNDPKSIQKLIKSAFKNLQNSGPEPPKSRSGGVRGRFGRVLGHLGPAGLFLEASWTVLEASWGRLGGVLGRLGAKKVANMSPSWFQKRSQNE